ncbi:hypothetical protein PVAND_017233 [Polypedilum vanderplanki]|uniref:Uncharacterized protein n=1 Tax=Polypedilum vanderplanki TaxID=319348 RepID=A0A9J6BHH6_POLVA|nr:hypothetical protein PVAND_017233 [Polypedilum vanderplanki]
MMKEVKFILKIFTFCFVIKKKVYGGTYKYVFPPTSPTRHQLISGIGVPLQLEHESITYGWTMKAQYFLPEVINQLKWQFWPDIFENYTKEFLFDQVWHRFPNGRRKREIVIDPKTGQQYEKYDGIVEEISNEPLKNVNEDEDDFDDEFEEDKIEKKMLEEYQKRPQTEGWSEEKHPDLSSSRWSIYEAFVKALENNKFNGRVCLLRAICEASRTEFHQDYLMGELFHVFFTPSTTAASEPVTKPSDYDYIKAEMMGKEDENGDKKICEQAFKDCKESIMDVFTQIFDTVI